MDVTRTTLQVSLGSLGAGSAAALVARGCATDASGFAVSVRVPADAAAAEVMRRVDVALGRVPTFASVERFSQ